MIRKTSWVKRSIRRILGTISPKLLATVDNYRVTGRFVDWKHPKDINEKILWLSLYSNTEQWSELADKYAVRGYLTSKGLDSLLPKLYGVWENAEDIDFNKLPDQFILKTNHGSGTNIVVKNKAEIDENTTKKQLNEWLKVKFGWPYEPHYLRISPKIIAEELLDVRKQPIETSSLIDYKCFCFSGKVDVIWSCYNRTSSHVYVDTHLSDWSYHPELSVFSDQYRDGKNAVPRPHNLTRMIEVCETLSKDFPQVRIDFYEVDNKLYFGEMTFTSNSGTMTFFTNQCLKDMGDKVHIIADNHK